MAKPITFRVRGRACSECKKMYTRREWRLELHNKCIEFGDTNVWDSIHLCYDCYSEVHYAETSKDIWLHTPVDPEKLMLIHGYECHECERAFTTDQWYAHQDDKEDGGQTPELCYDCYNDGLDMRNYARS